MDMSDKNVFLKKSLLKKSQQTIALNANFIFMKQTGGTMKNMRILIVDEEKAIQDVLRVKLEKQGFQITSVASTGMDAILLAEGTMPDLVLMDINLDGRLNGIQAATRIRYEFDIPVIFITGDPSPETLQGIKTADSFGFLTKPFNYDQLFPAIDIAIFRHQIEKKLQIENRLLRAHLNKACKATVVCDPRGKACLVNDLFMELAGMSKGEIMNAPITELLAINKDLHNINGVLLRKDGKFVAVTVEFGDLVNSTNNLLGRYYSLEEMKNKDSETSDHR
jgi:CheY-like chemotaxis protein